MKQFALFVAMFAALASLSARGQSVVINEFRNATPDVVELLVVQNNLDMRGMILKDYSSSGTTDNGGGYSFSTNALWSSVPAGTLIVLRRDLTAADVTVGGSDYNLDVGLSNTTYFVVESGSFDIATSDILQIKASGSGKAGSTGAIHSFASGSAGSAAFYTGSPTPKLATASGDTGANESAEAGNATATLADFNGTDAAGNGATGTIGTWNNANNQTYIVGLRGGGGGGPATNVQFTASSGSATEGDGTFVVTVIKTEGVGAVSAQVVLGGTATQGGGSDYTVSTTNLVLNGATTSATITVTINDDAETEIAETVTLTLVNVTGGVIGSPGAFTLTITDNDAPAGSGLMISQYTETDVGSTPKGIEVWNNTGSTITFDSGANKLDVKVGANGGAPASVITVESGSLADGNVLVIGTADMTPDAEEPFNYNGDDAVVLEFGGVVVDMIGVAGTDPGSAWTGGGVSTLNQNIQLKAGITTSDPNGWTDPSERFETVDVGSVLTGFGTAPGGTPTVNTNVRFTVASAAVGENVGSYILTITKSLADGNVSGEIGLGGTATLGGGADYTISATNFTMNGATTSATVTITINDDGDTESSETVILTLANVVGGTIVAPSVFTLTVTDNDAGPPPAGSPWINEVDYDSAGTDSNEWVEISGPAGLSLNDYELVMINDGGTAYNTFDLAPAAWTFADEGNGYGFIVVGQVRPGEGTADFTPAGWTTDEMQNGPADSIQLRQKVGPVNVHLVDYEGNNANTSDDQNTTANDNTTDALTSIYLTGGPGSGFADFGWTNVIGNATPGAVNNGQTLTPATVTTNLKFAVASATVGEADGTYVVTIVKTAPDGNLSAQLALGGTATLGGGNDYTIDTTNVTLNGATTSATVTVTINNDVAPESAETVILNLTNVVGGGLTTPFVFTLTINDNDGAATPPVLNAIGNKTTLTNALLTFAVSATATEGDPVVMTVSNAPGGSTFGTTNTAGTFTWAAPGPAGVYTVTFYAADDDGADSETITITVTNTPAGPGGGGMQQNLWFNELHYDNVGGDTNEGFEIAGPAGTDLSGYTVYFYDGDLLTSYSNAPLSGVIPNLSNGYGVIWFEAAYNPAGALQNGPNDGIALVYQGTGVVQFISYEGSLTPNDGPAAGIPAVNIGSQSSTAIGINLFLCGTGTNYAQMAATGGWQTNVNSRGAFSPCQVIPAPAGGGTDDDADLIPNDWETLYFGSTTGATATVDTDGDSFINLDEYIAGTIPTNGNSFFEFSNLTPSGSIRVLEFATVTGRLYQVLYTTNLITQTWTDRTNGIIGTGGFYTLGETNDGNRIYQIRTRLNLP